MPLRTGLPLLICFVIAFGSLAYAMESLTPFLLLVAGLLAFGCLVFFWKRKPTPEADEPEVDAMDDFSVGTEVVMAREDLADLLGRLMERFARDTDHREDLARIRMLAESARPGHAYRTEFQIRSEGRAEPLRLFFRQDHPGTLSVRFLSSPMVAEWLQEETRHGGKDPGMASP